MNQQQKLLKVLLIGDSCTDIYQYGSVSRINPEAPTLIFDAHHSDEKSGMASNVYSNLLNLRCNVDLITEFVQDKTRYIDLKTKQQLLRVDSPIIKKSFDRSKIKDISQYDRIVISDYDKGYLTYEDIEYIISISKCQVYLDTKKPDLKRFNGAILKLNQYEWELKISENDKCIVTYGGDKVVYNNKIYYPPKVNLYDACGAGDTFLAAYSVSNSIEFAMKAAAITVQHIGVYSPTLEEIND